MARILPDGMAEAFAGSTADARLQFNVWYDGRLVATDVPVANWSQDWDRARQIVGQTKATIIDEDGTLTPWGVNDALGVAGPMLQTQLTAGGTSLNIGHQRITASEPEETWRIVGGKLIWVPGAATVPVEAQDLTCMASGSRFMAPEVPPAGATVFGEIRRLLRGIMDVIFEPTLADRNVPASMVYKEDRMDAVEDLAKGISAACRVTGGGVFEVYDPELEVSVFDIKSGQEGQLINVRRSLSVDGLYNAVVSQNTLDGGREIQGVAVETSGPLRLDGPHGRWPTFRSAPFATTQAQIDADAATALKNRAKTRSVLLPIRTTLNPAIEVGDWVTVQLPIITGETVTIPGRVQYVGWSGDGNGISAMDLKIMTRLADMQAVSEKIRTATWLG